MGGNRQRPRPRRRRNAPEATKPTVASRKNDDEPPVGGQPASTSVHDIPDDVLELVLLRLGSSAYLVRAASACKRWRRVVADAGFLARFRLLRVHLGLYHNCASRPVFLPSPSLGIPVSQQSFSLGFLPEVDGTWPPGGQSTAVTASSSTGTGTGHHCGADALTLTSSYASPRHGGARRSIILPPDRLSGRMWLGVFLLRGGATARDGGNLSTSMSNFRVMVVLLREHMLDRRRGVPEACVYQASTSERSWRDMNCAWKGNIDIPSATASFYFAGRADGSLYWAIEDAGGAALVLDEATAAVSLEALPVSIEGWCVARFFRVVGGEGRAPRAICLVDRDFRVVFSRLKGGGEWVLENLVRFPGRATIVAGHETCVVVETWNRKWRFFVDLETMAVVERVRMRNSHNYTGPAYPYELPWPPSLNA